MMALTSAFALNEDIHVAHGASSGVMDFTTHAAGGYPTRGLRVQRRAAVMQLAGVGRRPWTTTITAGSSSLIARSPSGFRSIGLGSRAPKNGRRGYGPCPK
jgi:hypothetical protein